MEEELKILFYALCDGLRQEVRSRRLFQLAVGQDLSLSDERERGFVSSLAVYIRQVGYFVQLESYFSNASLSLQPDLCIWMPASNKYLYLEHKTVGWGEEYSYRLPKVKEDLEKLEKITGFDEKIDFGKGILVIGFAKHNEESQGKLWQKFNELSQYIQGNYTSYRQVGLKSVDLQGLTEKSSCAIIGMWVHEY